MVLCEHYNSKSRQMQFAAYSGVHDPMIRLHSDDLTNITGFELMRKIFRWIYLDDSMRQDDLQWNLVIVEDIDKTGKGNSRSWEILFRDSVILKNQKCSINHVRRGASFCVYNTVIMWLL
jgi:hypothetical protein